MRASLASACHGGTHHYRSAIWRSLVGQDCEFFEALVIPPTAGEMEMLEDVKVYSLARFGAYLCSIDERD